MREVTDDAIFRREKCETSVLTARQTHALLTAVPCGNCYQHLRQQFYRTTRYGSADEKLAEDQT
jgi:hypothetical protein